MKKHIITLLMIVANLTSNAYSSTAGDWAYKAIKEARNHGNAQVSATSSKAKKVILDTQKLQEKHSKKNLNYRSSITHESGPLNRKRLKEFKLVATQIEKTRGELDSLPQSQCSRFDNINYESDLLKEKESCKLIYVAILKCKAKKSKNKEIQTSLEDQYPNIEENCYEI